MHTLPAMKTTQNNLPTHCFDCEEPTQWELYTALDSTEVKGKTVEYPTSNYQCEHCGYEFLTTEQLKNDLLSSTEAYQHKYGLLTASEVKRRRNALGLSQQGLCDLSKGVEIASLKRLEMGQRVQNDATDLAITTALMQLEDKRRHNEERDLALHDVVANKVVSQDWSSTVVSTVVGSFGHLGLAAGVILCARGTMELTDKNVDLTTNFIEYQVG